MLVTFTDKFKDMLNKWVFVSPLVGMMCFSFADVLPLLSSSMQPDGTYRALANGEVVSIHPSSVIRNRPECLVYNELVETSRKFIRNTTRIDFLWLTELAPQFYAMQN